MQTDPFLLLCRLLKYAGLTVHGASFGGRDELQPLVELGILVPDGRVAEVTCSECGEVHSAPIVATHEGLRAVCSRIGQEFEPEIETATYRMDAKAAPELVARSLGLTDEVRQVLGHGNVWALGTIREPPYRVALYFAVQLDDLESASALLRTIEARSRSVDIGLIVANETHHSFRPSATRVAVVSLRDVMRIGPDGSLDVNREDLFRLVIPEEQNKSRKVGAPARQRNRIIPILNELSKEGQIIDTSNECCRTVQDRYIVLYGAPAPAKDTIRTAVSHWKANDDLH